MCATHLTEINLAICILFFEKLDQTIECIQSFLSSDVKIYVLNNGSSLSARQALGRFCDSYKQIKIFDSDVNLGVGVGRNYLITHTTEEWLLFVDNDITVNTRYWVQKFAQCVSRYPDIEVFITKLYDIKKRSYIGYPPFRIVGEKVIRDSEVINDLTNNFPGGASFINRKLFDRLGLYDDKMFVGVEDYELCIRGLCLGEPIKARQIHSIELIHSHRRATKNEDKKAIKVRYDWNLIATSYNRITEKYNLIVDVDWIRLANNIEHMVKSGSITKGGLKQRARSIAKRVLRRSIEMVFVFASFVLPSQVKRILKKTFHLTPMPGPMSCSLYLTDRCNFRCQGCYRSVIGVKKFREMTLPTVQKLLSLYPFLGTFTVAGLGEPTLCPDFVNIINFLRKNRKFVGIITNGTNLNQLLALSYEPNYISISLKGYDNESYLSNSGLDAFDSVIETFSKLKLRFKNIGFSYILKRGNYRDLDRLLQLCDDLKPEFLHLTNYLVYDPSVQEEVQQIITVKDSEIIDYVNEVCAGRDYIKLKPVYVDFDNPNFNCKSYDYKINLDGDGNIGGCQRQIPPDASFGNIFTDIDPYNSLEMRKCRDLMHKNSYVHPECRFCFGNWGP